MYHKHKCKFCGLVWDHHDCNDVSHNAVPGAHECPGCHRCNWGLGIYEGAEEPRVRNGKDVAPGACGIVIHPDQKGRTS